jgi:hypothetical protein
MKHARRGEKIQGAFLALPHHVIMSAEFLGLSHAARSLLILVAAQLRLANNGRLVATPKYLRPLGWVSNDLTTRCLRELMATRLLVRTRMGACPNRAAWYGVSWRDVHGSQSLFDEITLSTHRKFLGTPINPLLAGRKIKVVVPPDGKPTVPIAPSNGTSSVRPIPPDGVMCTNLARLLYRPAVNSKRLPYQGSDLLSARLDGRRRGEAPYRGYWHLPQV